MQKRFVKILSIILSLCVIATSTAYAYADEDATTTTKPATTEKAPSDESLEQAEKELNAQRDDLEKKIAENDKILAETAESAKETEEYINILDEKIGYINEDLNLLDGEIRNAEAKVNSIDKKIKVLQKDVDALQSKFDEINEELDGLEDQFSDTYDAYCLRLRAMYISGSDSLIAALLTSKDLSQFFARYQMIRAIARSDTKLLNEVKDSIKQINEAKEELSTEKKELDEKGAELGKKRDERKSEQNKIENKKKEVVEKKVQISELRAESDSLLASYAEKTQMYGEYRNEDEALLESVNKEIDDLLSGLKTPEEVTTAVSTTGNGTSKPAQTGSATGDLFAGSNAVLSMCYPVPGHHGVSASFGYYSNGRPHSGTDFPCPIGSKVVAAQKGIVITVKRLDYSYGYYVMIYHGTDKKGRKIVTLYAHNSSILVSEGQTVIKGQQIAKSGSTGNSTGPHSHFEVIIDGTKVNAINYLG